MLEQSKLNGPVYHSKTNTKSVATRQVDIPDIKFGPPVALIIHRNPMSDKLLVEDVQNQEAYVYGQHCEQLVKPITYENDKLYKYYCGIAEFENEKQVYWIKNQPPVTISDQVVLTELTLPASITGYPYEQTFTFSDELIDILGPLTATYVDKYKRPLNAEAMENDIYLPIGIDKVTSKFHEIVNKHTHFPIVCQLDETPFGLLDLEPGYTDEELAEAESYQYIYKETTPRGGIHYLIRTDSEAFKYRVSEHLEVIVNAMVTFYGGGEIKDINAPTIPESQFSEYKELGHQSIEVKKSDKDVVAIVDKLQFANKRDKTLGEQMVTKQYEIDHDLSHADFMSCIHLMEHNIGPYLKSIKTFGFTDDDIPWIIAEYVSRLIEFRLKHNREIVGVPYLVYVATKVYSQYTKPYESKTSK